MVGNAFGYSAANPDSTYNESGETALQGAIAAVLMAVLVAIFYCTARLKLSVAWSLIVAVGAGFGTQILSTASRALWSETWSALLIGIVVYWLARDAVGRKKINPYALASVLAWTYFVRPTNAVTIALVSGYLWLYRRELFARYVLVGAAWGALFVGYSEYHFGQLLPNYYLANRLNFAQAAQALPGNFISPARGVLVYAPVLLFVAYLVMRYRRNLSEKRLVVLSLVACTSHFIAIAGFTPWDGGFCYGARYITSLVPYFAWLSIAGLAARFAAQETDETAAHNQPRKFFDLRKLETICGALLLFLSIDINARGAYSRATWQWNVRPQTVMENPSKVWDWRNPQFLAGWVMPPAPADVYPLRVGEQVQLNAPGAGQTLLWYGWNEAEAQGHWTDGSEAALPFALTASENFTNGQLELTLHPYLNAEHGVLRQRLRVMLNGHEIGATELTSGEQQKLVFKITRAELAPRNILTLGLPDAVAPHVVGDGADERTLGVYVETVGIVISDE